MHTTAADARENLGTHDLSLAFELSEFEAEDRRALRQ